MVDAERSAPQLERHKDQLRESPGNYKTESTSMNEQLRNIELQQLETNNLQECLTQTTRQRNHYDTHAYINGAIIAQLSRAAGVSRNTIYRYDGREHQ